MNGRKEVGVMVDCAEVDHGHTGWRGAPLESILGGVALLAMTLGDLRLRQAQPPAGAGA